MFKTSIFQYFLLACFTVIWISKWIKTYKICKITLTKILSFVIIVLPKLKYCQKKPRKIRPNLPCFATSLILFEPFELYKMIKISYVMSIKMLFLNYQQQKYRKNLYKKRNTGKVIQNIWPTWFVKSSYYSGKSGFNVITLETKIRMRCSSTKLGQNNMVKFGFVFWFTTIKP